MEECYANTDLEWRLAQIPDHAACRGIYLSMLDDRASEFGPAASRAYRDYFQTYRFSAFRQHPLKDYLTRIVKLAQIQFGAEHIYKGIFEIQAAAWPAWRNTLVGRATFGIIGNDFEGVLRVMRGAYSKSVNYATFELERRSPDHFVIRLRNEYNYIEHAMAGALTGIARVCGVLADVDIRLTDPFNGDLDVRLSRPRVAAVQ